jgi:hypothetical protein
VAGDVREVGGHDRGALDAGKADRGPGCTPTIQPEQHDTDGLIEARRDGKRVGLDAACAELGGLHMPSSTEAVATPHWRTPPRHRLGPPARVQRDRDPRSRVATGVAWCVDAPPGPGGASLWPRSEDF